MTSEIRPSTLRHRMAERLAAAGHLRSPEWRAAVEMVPRHEFVPAFFVPISTADTTLWEPVTSHGPDRDRWLHLVYGDESLVTQLDGNRLPFDVKRAVEGKPTSSSTMPSLVVRMWEDLRVEDDSRVLEIGTGTGYSTALGCHRLGDVRIVSMEVDDHLAACARAALQAVGYRPTIVTGDGLQGHAARAPYDRVIATCAVQQIPTAWVEQTRRGGLILVTISGGMWGSGLAQLTVAGDGRAEGRFLPGDVGFMLARAHAAPPVTVTEEMQSDGHVLTSMIGTGIFGIPTARFVAQIAAPGAVHIRASLGNGPMVDYLIDPERDAWAALSPDGGVRQGGAVPLWEHVEEAILIWRAAGEPDIKRFRIRVERDRQTIWLDGADTELAGTLYA